MEQGTSGGLELTLHCIFYNLKDNLNSNTGQKRISQKWDCAFLLIRIGKLTQFKKNLMTSSIVSVQKCEKIVVK